MDSGDAITLAGGVVAATREVALYFCIYYIISMAGGRVAAGLRVSSLLPETIFVFVRMYDQRVILARRTRRYTMQAQMLSREQ